MECYLTIEEMEHRYIFNNDEPFLSWLNFSNRVSGLITEISHMSSYNFALIILSLLKSFSTELL